MPPAVYLWNRAPFVRLLISFTAGIVMQWHLQLDFHLLLYIFLIGIAVVFLYSLLSINNRYRYGIINGIAINMALVCAGALWAWLHDIRNDPSWLGHQYQPNDYVAATILEPLVEKTNSYKALAEVEFICQNDSCKKFTGKVILYFKKDTVIRQRLDYGAQIVFRKSLQEIKNAGNPGGFDYKRYSLFQGITHQVFSLARSDFEILSKENKSLLNEFIFKCREWVIQILRTYVHGEKEQGLAEALLIGYKDDLDKNLVQAYSNTGVVHVIAISGLHLGLIYWLLLLLTRPLKTNKKLVWLRLVLIIAALWMFSILAGGQPSVLRSAVMFTCIALGEVINRRTSIYNTLALSAFILLCINPYWLWDVGFQLSYAAVLSIVIFFRPIYNWYRPDNKVIDFFWKLNAVTIAAQLLTLPISIYHFHQVPALFLLTNIVAVPLSSIILIGEIFLCALFFVEPLANIMGNSLRWMIYLMNAHIERLDSVSFSTWNGLSINIIQTALFLIFVIGFCHWLSEKKKSVFWISAFCLFALLSLRAVSFIQAGQQKKIIVYNVPRYQAVDLIDGRSFLFIGDSDLLYDDFIRNFHIQPSRVVHRIQPAETIRLNSKDFDFGNTHISIIDTGFNFQTQLQKQNIDLLILSKNPKLYISNLNNSFSIKQIIIDGSVPAWKARLWKRDCDSLHIPCYDVSEKGAFVLNL